MGEGKEDRTENRNANSRRLGSDRRGNERRVDLSRGLDVLTRADEDALYERREGLRRIEYRRGPLDRRAPYAHDLDDAPRTRRFLDAFHSPNAT